MMTNEELLKNIEKARKTAWLYLSYNQLSSLPPELFQLTNLTTLYLSRNQLSYLPSEIGQLTNLTTLDLSRNQLSSLPPEIGQLTNLTELYLGGNQLSSLPPEIGQLTNLTTLYLSGNQLSYLPSEISQLTNLRQLDLGKNQLSRLPLEISQLTNLSALSLSGNQLSNLPPEISQLTNLTTLSLWANKLSRLPSEISQLTNLMVLYISDNQLSNLPSELGQLMKLNWLNLGKNKLSGLPSEIGQLTNLTTLDLNGNQLSNLPLEIGQLTNLRRLNLNGNQLSNLPLEIGQLTNLRRLDLNGNQLSNLPLEIGQLTKLWSIDLNGNPLMSPPPEIANKGIEAISKYFAELDKGQLPLNEVKVLLVGDGAAGKTSLVKQLRGEGFDEYEDTTHGINIQGWEQKVDGRKIRINIWDFGGQEIQHATHQFFLSKRSLYVLVLDGRKDERTEYWLRHVEAFGGDSPVLIVLNKIDSNPSFDLNRPFLLEKYPGIRDFFRISCKTSQGLAAFKEALLEELAKVEMIGTVWPGTWFTVKRKLEQMDKPYISAEEYKSYCAEAGITEEESRETLVDFLHDLGVAVHFRDFILDAMHVLDPVWVTEAVYKIITAKEMVDSKGLLHLHALKEILKELPAPRLDRLRTMLRLRCAKRHCFPVETHSFIMRLMQKFELCYSVGEEAVLIPQLLPVVEPDFTFRQDSALRFALHYPDFLPPSVFPRFMVKVHEDIHENTCWRTGVLLKDKRSEAQALVKVDMEARRINIWVQGDKPREYLHYLRYILVDINSSFEKLTVSERVPMPDEPQRTADYETLLKYAERGIDRYIPEGSDKDYSVYELLGLVQPKDADELARVAEKASPQDMITWTELINELFDSTWTVPVLGITLNMKAFFAKLLERQKAKRNASRS